MKKLVIIILLLLSGLCLFAEDNTNTTGEVQKGKIVLPDKPIIITDESKETIEDKEKKEDFKRSKIDTDELSKVQISKKLKEEIDAKKTEEYSISSLEFSYGMYENFLVNMQLGKKITNFNYFVSFLRNTRGSAGRDNNLYFNTERAIDDLYLNLGYEINENFNISFDGGYYSRTLGLFTNSMNLNETKFFIPLKIESTYKGPDFLKINVNLSGQYLNLKHKTRTDYNSTNLYELSLPVTVEKTWSAGNFLNGELFYNLYYAGETEHSFGIGIKDRFPLLSFLSLQLGGYVFIYSYKYFFWAPELFIFYRPSDRIEIKTGLTGSSDSKKNQFLLKENQIYYTNFMPEEKWNYLIGVYFTLIENMVLGCEANYDYFYSYRNFAFNENMELYYVKNITNLNLITINPFMKFNFLEDLAISLSGKIRFFDYNEVLRLNQYEIIGSVSYYVRKIGFNIESQLSYIGPKKLKDGVMTQSLWKWGISFSQKAGENLILQFKLNNILNQEIVEEIYLPESGFSFDAGLIFRF